MKYLQEFLKETATTGASSAGDVAGVRGALFSRPIKREKLKASVQRIKFHHDARKLSESFLKVVLAETPEGSFKATDIISKLKSAGQKFDYEKDSVAFGLDDENGNTVKVFVRADQAEHFERVLSEIIGDEQEVNNDIPEILFNLRDKFTITHIDWGKVEEDEEIKPESGEPKDEDEFGGEETTDLTNDVEDDLGEFEDGVSDEQSALDKVISLLKADADAKTAEAKAKEAEAKAKEAEYAAKIAEIKIRGEEEVLDMETHFKAQDAEKKEAQKLAKLAKYRHEKAAESRSDNDVGIKKSMSIDMGEV